MILATGADRDRRLGIAGEDLPGVLGAATFAAWYNDHPAHRGLVTRLAQTRRAVVIGNGNVALDAARILAAGDRVEAPTMAAHARTALRTSPIGEVVIVGRRGPREASFTQGELLELAASPHLDLVVEGIGDEDLRARDGDDELTRGRLAALRTIRDRPAVSGRSPRRLIVFRFHSAPVAFLGESTLTGVRLQDTGPEPGPEVDLACQSAVTAIGFTADPPRGVPTTGDRRLIAHRDGRVVDAQGAPVPGLYCVGWAKRGPTGVIGTNRACASQTVATLVADHLAAPRPGPQPPRTTPRLLRLFTAAVSRPA